MTSTNIRLTCSAMPIVASSSNYAANAGKSGGEFFTPQHVSKLIAQLAMHGQTHVNKIYDPAAGSGSLLFHF